MVGGNDIASGEFTARQFEECFDKLVRAFHERGVNLTAIFPIPPREQTRPQDVTPEKYRKLQKVANKGLRVKFGRPIARPEATFIRFNEWEDFLSRDGVHPSHQGWCSIMKAVKEMVENAS